MFGKFLPQETSFFDLFEQHAAITVRASQEFEQLFTHPILELTDIHRFKNLEHEGDVIVHECVEALHKTFITPIDREDILRLISSMDDILDYIDACFECLVIYKIKNTTPELQQMAKILSQACFNISLIVKGLRNMKNAAEMRANCKVIRKLEDDGDNAFRNALGKLFDEEQDTRLVIKLKEIYEILEDAIDSCHRVANVIEGIILECD